MLCGPDAHVPVHRVNRSTAVAGLGGLERCWPPSLHASPLCSLLPAPQCSNLMAKQDLRDLGFAEGEAPAPAKPKQQDKPKRRIETEGYLAGMKRFEDVDK